MEMKIAKDQGKGRLSAVGRRYFSLIEFDEKEELLLEIRKHPFGLAVIVLTGLIIALVVFLGTSIIAASQFISEIDLDFARRYIALFGFLLSVLIIGVSLVYAQLYRNSVVYVTNEKVAQVLYLTLFNRKISQLGVGDVQDVTVIQRGFLASLFNYGTLVIETAGEQQNYTFSFVPEPHKASKIIVSAHEENLKLYGN